VVVSNVFISVTAANTGHFAAGGTVFMTNQFGKEFDALVPGQPTIDIAGTLLTGGFAKSIRGVVSQSQSSGTVLTNGYSVLLAGGAYLEYGTPLTANPDSYSMASNTTSVFGVATNDTSLSPGAPRTNITVTAVSVTNGVATITDSTNITFTPDADFVGTLTIGYTATDEGGFSGNGTVTVTVTNVPSGPTTIVPTIPPAITSLIFSNGSLYITGTNAQATGVYYILSSTNVTLPLSQWTPVSTNIVNTSNGFSLTGTNVVTPGAAGQFYILSSTNYR